MIYIPNVAVTIIHIHFGLEAKKFINLLSEPDFLRPLFFLSTLDSIWRFNLRFLLLFFFFLIILLRFLNVFYRFFLLISYLNLIFNTVFFMIVRIYLYFYLVKFFIRNSLHYYIEEFTWKVLENKFFNWSTTIC